MSKLTLTQALKKYEANPSIWSWKQVLKAAQTSN